MSFERPGNVLESRARAIDAESPSGRPLGVLSLEDTIISRMQDLAGGGHLESWNQTLTLLRVADLDRLRLERRVNEENLTHALERLDWGISQIEGGRIFEAFEVHDFFPTFRDGPTI